jgi:hypothetical protein
MLKVTIVDRGEPVLPDPRDPLVQTWRDYEGKVCAYAYSSHGDRWLHVPNVASYQIGSTNGEIAAFPQHPARPEKVLDIFSRVVLPIALHARGIEVLHASAVSTQKGIIAFCAMADTGKSTTAYALSQRGYEQWADDAVPFEIEENSVRVVPLDFGVRLDPDAEKFLKRTSIKSSDLRRRQIKERQTATLAIIFVLKRFKTNHYKEVEVVRLSPAQAFRSVLLHGHFFNLKNTELMRQMVSNYLRLTSIVPVFEIHFIPGFEKMTHLLDKIEEVTETLPAGASG